MKTPIIIGLLFFCSFSFGQENQNKQENQMLEQAKKELIRPNSNIPGHITFMKGNEPSMNELPALLNRFSKLKIELKEIKRETDELGFTRVKFQQMIGITPLELNFVTAHIQNGKITEVSGNLQSKKPVSDAITVNETQALANALLHIGAIQYKWELPEEELFIKKDLEDSSATFYPKSELVYLETELGLELCHKFNIYAQKPVSRADYYVAVSHGKVIFTNHYIHHANSIGTANTGYSGTQTITTDSLSPFSYRLRETGRGNGIETYDMNNGTTYGNAVDFTDNDNNWTTTSNLNQYALDAHWGAEMTYDYFSITHARNSIDNQGFKLKSYIHYDANFVNAFWDGNRMTYGDGDGTTISPLTSLAIAGHEIAHGLTSNTANLVYSYESGALNESFSDIFGLAIDFWARPTQADWEMGDEIYIGGGNFFRSMANPNLSGDPDTYQGTNWYAGTLDHGGVHTNSGVQNFWFYLLVNGGTGTNDIGDTYSVTGLGMDTAARIAYRNLTAYLTTTSQYSDARFYSIKSAVDLFGACSPAVIATTNAWHAVGVGDAYSSGVQAKFTTNDTIGCTAPHSVTFVNNSSNATSFVWNFGDGTTSTLLNPTHIYTAMPGPFTVSLIADGETCGIDTLVKLNNIVIDTNSNCPDYMTNLSNATSNFCTGKLFDDGGVTGNYGSNVFSTFTISPTGATSVTLNTVSFDLEQDGTCNFDYLEIYEGTSTAGTLIGKYCNGSPPPPSITSGTSSVFIVFSSDQSVEGTGFEINWDCSSVSPIPLSSFTPSAAVTCRNKPITLANSSSNATSYSWQMIGASIPSTSQVNPTIAYSANGTYTVRLIANNAGFRDTSYQTIIVDGMCMPASGTVIAPTTCSGKILDNGGQSGNYGSNQSSTVVIAPLSAVNITLTFNSFDLEANNCIYDYLLVYDGGSASAPLIGKYCNSNRPPSNITSSGNEITLKFESDNGLELAGFDIDWHCSLVGLSETENISGLKIYPNPAENRITIEAKYNRQSESEIVIMDLLGKTLYHEANKEKTFEINKNIDISGFASGTYMIYLNGKATKFVKY